MCHRTLGRQHVILICETLWLVFAYLENTRLRNGFMINIITYPRLNGYIDVIRHCDVGVYRLNELVR